MKFKNPKVSVPYIGMDEEGNSTREWAHFNFNGVVDRRRVKREVRKWIKRNLGRTVYTPELLTLVKIARITAA